MEKPDSFFLAGAASSRVYAGRALKNQTELNLAIITYTPMAESETGSGENRRHTICMSYSGLS